MSAPAGRRRAMRLLLGGAVGAAAPAVSIAATKPGGIASKTEPPAVPSDGATVPSPAALARPVPRGAPALAVARLAQAEARRAALQSLGDRLRQASRDLDVASTAASKVSGRRSDVYLLSGSRIAESVGTELFDSGVWELLVSVHADTEQAKQSMQRAARAHADALLSLAAGPSPQQAALRAVADEAQARETARRRLVAARRRYAALVKLTRPAAWRADVELERWTEALTGLASDVVAAQLRWRRAAGSSAALRQALDEPAVREAIGVEVPARLGANLPSEPPWTLTTAPKDPASPKLADVLDEHRMLQGMLGRASSLAERAADAAAWMAMTRQEAGAAAAVCGDDACARFAADEQAALDEARRSAETMARTEREEAQLAGRLRDAATAWQAALGERRALDAQVQQHALSVADDANRTLAAERRTLTDFAGPAFDAEAQALRAWADAWRAVHGVAPVLVRAMPVAELTAAAAPPESYAPGSANDGIPVAGHALHRLVDFDDEPRGFGVYTYVLVLTRMGSGRDLVRQRLQRIERAVRDLVPAREVKAEVRGSFNAFVMPTGPQLPAADGVAYDVMLAQQLAGRLPAGWHLPDGIRAARIARPGPFLVSLPVPASQAQRDSPVLFADLSDTPTLAVSDVVDTYMKSLQLPDAKDAAVRGWRPPAQLKVAMTLVRVSQTTGELFSAFFPTASAAPR